MDGTLDSLEYTLWRYAEHGPPQMAFQNSGRGDLAAWQLKARAKLRELLGGFPAACATLPDVKLGAAVRRDGLTRRELWFPTRPGLAAFGYLILPDPHAARSTPGGAVICLPGHGRGVDEIVGLDGDGEERALGGGYQRDFALQCAQRGFVTLALEPLGFGRRRDPAARERGMEAWSCQPAAGAALLLGETMIGWRVWDVMRAIDWLAAREEVDPERLGLVGISGGGTVALYTAALDTRVAVTVLSCSFCTFRDSIFGVSHCIDNYVPGILNWFEMADLAGLIAPRRLFVESGTRDPLFPEAGVRAALDAAGRIYQDADAPDHLQYDLFDGEHQFAGDASLPFLQASLR